MGETKEKLVLRLSEVLKERRVTSVALADAVGISKVAISNYITGRAMPSFDKAVAIAKFLGVDVSELIEGETPQHSSQIFANSLTCPKCGAQISLNPSVQSEE